MSWPRGKMGGVTWKAPDVTRPEGPTSGPERPMLQAFLDWHRATLLYKCAGLTGAQLAEHSVPPSGLSLLGLVRHMTKVERTWCRQRFAGEQVDPPFGEEKAADFERVDPDRAAAGGPAGGMPRRANPSWAGCGPLSGSAIRPAA